MTPLFPQVVKWSHDDDPVEMRIPDAIGPQRLAQVLESNGRRILIGYDEDDDMATQIKCNHLIMCLDKKKKIGRKKKRIKDEVQIAIATHDIVRIYELHKQRIILLRTY